MIFFRNFWRLLFLWAFTLNFTVISYNSVKNQIKSRQNSKSCVSSSEIYKRYNLTDDMVKNAVCKGYWTEINTSQIRAAKNGCSEQFSAILRCSYLENIDFCSISFTHCIFYHIIYQDISSTQHRTYSWRRNTRVSILADFSSIFQCIC